MVTLRVLSVLTDGRHASSSLANGHGHGVTRGPAADMRAWVDKRAGYVTSQGTKPPLRALNPLHAISHTMPAHVLCLAAARLWSNQSPKGPAQSESTHARMAAAGPLFTPTPSPFTRKRGMSPSTLWADDLDAAARADEPRADPAHDADDECAADGGP